MVGDRDDSDFLASPADSSWLRDVSSLKYVFGCCQGAVILMGCNLGPQLTHQPRTREVLFAWWTPREEVGPRGVAIEGRGILKKSLLAGENEDLMAWRTSPL